MIIMNICGGLGNQMFQYAAGRRLALHHQTELKLDLRAYRGGTEARPAELAAFARPVKLNDLSIDAAAASDEEIFRLRDRFVARSARDRLVRHVRRYVKGDFLWPPSHIVERQYRFEPQIFDLPDNVYLEGFWQSWKYFSDIAPTIRQEFRMKDTAVAELAQSYLQQLRQNANGSELVSLHWRRGDLAHAVDTLGKAELVYGGPVGLEYILAAIRRFDAATHFLVFSDTPKDIQWCRENIRADWLEPARLHFSEGHTDLQDMALMSACDHHIIANSTFSWWSAWLDDSPGRRVIAPGRWSSPAASKQMPVDDLVPPDWEII